jgi:hypothetical protein
VVFQNGSSISMLREALLHRTLLVLRLQACNFKRMRVVELRGAKRLFCLVDEFQQLQSPVLCCVLTYVATAARRCSGRRVKLRKAT